ncbi:hypothetical protein SDC9_206811 [bioreactor metagenome]|uniref:Uncharacterized protein n=1 Tax=bioreactor metagenome TaxID=1076179 RepID=A0A645JHL5_9ZZZZ
MIAMGFEECSFVRKMKKPKAILTLIGGILMIVPNVIADIIAIAILIYVVISERRLAKIEKEIAC